jgi:hypothetical protein
MLRLQRPVFVVSPPRSGAALLFEVLTHSTAFSPIRDAAELLAGIGGQRLDGSAVTPEIAQAVREGFVARLHHGGQRLIEHSPQSALRVPFFTEVFPDAQFLCVLREPPAAMASMLDALRRDGSVTEAALPAREVARQYAAATMQLLDDLAALDDARVHYVRYERLVDNWPAELLRLSALLGIPPLPPRIAFSAEKVAASEEEIAPHADLAADAAQRVRQLAVSRAARLGASPAPAPPQEMAPNAFVSVVSGPFAEILHDLGASILLTTYQSGQIVFLRAHDRTTLNTHFRPLRGPMGVAAGKDFLAIGTHQEVFEYRNQPGVAANLQPPGVNDAVWVPSNVHVTGDIRIHELAFAAGELWAVNTLFSTLCTIDRRHSFVPRWRPPFITHLAPEDRCHLNGMAVDGDRIRLVTALGETNTPGGWRSRRTDGGAGLRRSERPRPTPSRSVDCDPGGECGSDAGSGREEHVEPTGTDAGRQR